MLHMVFASLGLESYITYNTYKGDKKMWLGGTLRIKEKLITPHEHAWDSLKELERQRNKSGWHIKNIQVEQRVSQNKTVLDIYMSKNFEHRDFDIQEELKQVNALTCKVDLYTSHDSFYQPK